MIEVPETRYAKSGDVNIAYQVLGEGPMDLVHVPPFISNLEIQWEDAAYARYMQRLASFSRLIMFDKRGTGLSDRVDIASLEERMDDVRAVMDAADSDRAVIFGSSEGGALAILFAVTYPERVSALVLYGAYPRMSAAPDYPDGKLEISEDDLRDFEDQWGQPGGGLAMPFYNPGQAEDAAYQEARARSDRMSASPGAATAILRMILSLDVRDLLPAIRVPTLVVYRTSDIVRTWPVAATSANTSWVRKSSSYPATSTSPTSATTTRSSARSRSSLPGARPARVPDRVLATVLFTDIVGSTQTAASVGDQRWIRSSEHHDDLAARRSSGTVVAINPTGDGVLATFDGPARAVRCAQRSETARPLGIEVRAGLHTGEIERRGDDIGGIAVHIGARVTALAGPGEVLVSSTVKDLVAGSGITFADRGYHVLMGVPDEWRDSPPTSSRP